ncbi:MAG: CPBP family intramembrane metalloprotease [Anaerolineaceae bacterium]|nr:CPBP family intramembrane metalloprotease [Anaerolineaceae bacterium]
MDKLAWLGFVIEWMGAFAVVMIAGTSPLLKLIRRIDFRFPRREATFALSVFALSYFLAFQYFGNPIFQFLLDFSKILPGGELAQRTLLAVICLVLFLLATFLRGQPLKSIGWSKANLRPGLTLGLLLVIITIVLRGKFSTLLQGVSPEQGGLLLACLLLAVAEETIFRGYIQLRLNSFIGVTWGWLATAFLFLLWQFPGRLWVLPFSEVWPSLVISLAQALLLGWIMRKSGHVSTTILFRAVAAWLILI